MTASLPSAIVTGASRGIGYACAETLVAEQFRVAGIARFKEPTAAPPGVWALRGDVTSSKAVTNCVRRVEERWGAISVLVLCAGIATTAPFIGTSDAAYLDHFEVNYLGATRVIRAAIPGMVRRRYGRIILIGSVAPQLPFAGGSAYCASKAALHAMGRCLAVEFAAFGITVNVVAPGAVSTAMTAERPEWRRRAIDDAPLNRIGTPQDVALVVRFLASEAAACISGAVVNVDGGVVAASHMGIA